MAVAGNVTATDLGNAFAAVIRSDDAVQELWVSSDEGAIHLWLIVQPIDGDAERHLYGLEDVLYDQFPDVAFQSHVLNPRYYTRDVHVALPAGTAQIRLRTA